jgi:hypothetical protein
MDNGGRCLKDISIFAFCLLPGASLRASLRLVYGSSSLFGGGVQTTVPKRLL